jgi:hypothetical protein
MSFVTITVRKPKTVAFKSAVLGENCKSRKQTKQECPLGEVGLT